MLTYLIALFLFADKNVIRYVCTQMRTWYIPSVESIDHLTATCGIDRLDFPSVERLNLCVHLIENIRYHSKFDFKECTVSQNSSIKVKFGQQLP